MVQLVTQDLRAEPAPVVPRVGHVEVPDLVHLHRGRAGIVAVCAHVREPLVFLKSPLGHRQIPAVLMGQSLFEAQIDILGAHGVSYQPLMRE